MDFCYGFITFPELYLTLPAGISFDLMRYWDGQPVRFACCRRTTNGAVPEDEDMFWCVEIRMARSDSDSEGSSGKEELDSESGEAAGQAQSADVD